MARWHRLTALLTGLLFLVCSVAGVARGRFHRGFHGGFHRSAPRPFIRSYHPSGGYRGGYQHVVRHFSRPGGYQHVVRHFSRPGGYQHVVRHFSRPGGYHGGYQHVVRHFSRPGGYHGDYHDVRSHFHFPGIYHPTATHFVRSGGYHHHGGFWSRPGVRDHDGHYFHHGGYATPGYEVYSYPRFHFHHHYLGDYCPPYGLSIGSPYFFLSLGYFAAQPWWGPWCNYYATPYPFFPDYSNYPAFDAEQLPPQVQETAPNGPGQVEQELMLRVVSDYISNHSRHGLYRLADPDHHDRVWALHLVRAPALFSMDENHYTVLAGFQGHLDHSGAPAGVEVQFFLSRVNQGAPWQVDEARIVSANGVQRPQLPPPPGYPDTPPEG